MNIQSTVKQQAPRARFPKREKVEPRSEGYADTYEAATKGINSSDGMRKMLWVGGGIAAGAVAGHFAQPHLLGAGINPLLLRAILGNVGGAAGAITHDWNLPRLVPTTADSFNRAAYACLGTAAGIGLSAAIHHMGSNVAPWVGAAGGLLIGYGLHRATTNLALDHKQAILHNEIFKPTPPSVQPVNIFAGDHARIETSPRDYWLDPSLHPSTQVGNSEFLSPNLNYLQNYAEESIHGVGSAIFLKGSDAGPKPHLDQDSSPDDHRKAEAWLREANAERAFGQSHWRTLERSLENWADKSSSPVTRGVFSRVSSLTKSGGRDELFRELGMESKFTAENDHVALTIYQMPGGKADEPALLNLQGHRSDATFFFSNPETAKEAAQAFDSQDLVNSFDKLTEDSVLNVLPQPGDIGGVNIVASGPGRHCVMGQNKNNMSSFRVHVAALLDKALRDMKDFNTQSN